MEFGWLLWLHGLLERPLNCLQQQRPRIVFAQAFSSLPDHLKGEKKQEESNLSPSHAASSESKNIFIGPGSSQHQDGSHQLKQNARKNGSFSCETRHFPKDMITHISLQWNVPGATS